jgi:hypothetical protein
MRLQRFYERILRAGKIGHFGEIMKSHEITGIQVIQRAIHPVNMNPGHFRPSYGTSGRCETGLNAIL